MFRVLILFLYLLFSIIIIGAHSAATAVEVLKGSEGGCDRNEVRADIVCLSNLLSIHVTDEVMFDGAWIDIQQEVQK